MEIHGCQASVLSTVDALLTTTLVSDQLQLRPLFRIAEVVTYESFDCKLKGKARLLYVTLLFPKITQPFAPFFPLQCLICLPPKSHQNARQCSSYTGFHFLLLMLTLTAKTFKWCNNKVYKLTILIQRIRIILLKQTAQSYSYWLAYSVQTCANWANIR